MPACLPSSPAYSRRVNCDSHSCPPCRVGCGWLLSYFYGFSIKPKLKHLFFTGKAVSSLVHEVFHSSRFCFSLTGLSSVSVFLLAFASLRIPHALLEAFFIVLSSQDTMKDIFHLGRSDTGAGKEPGLPVIA